MNMEEFSSTFSGFLEQWEKRRVILKPLYFWGYSWRPTSHILTSLLMCIDSPHTQLDFFPNKILKEVF